MRQRLRKHSARTHRQHSPFSLHLEHLELRTLLTATSSVSRAAPAAVQLNPVSDLLPSYELVRTIDQYTQVYDINGQEFTLIIEPVSNHEHHDDEHSEHGDEHAGHDDGHAEHGDEHHEPADVQHDSHEPAHADLGSELTSSGVPLLHSNPAAPAKVFLDFDGNFEPSWGGNVNVTTPPYDIDGDPDSFNDEERERIIEVWQRVSEDFSPFNIDVTTEDPSASATTLNQVRGDSTRVRTFYFRHDFDVADANAVSALRVNLLRDDGAAVYLNGTEIVRDNLPENAAFDDLANGRASGDDEDRYWPFDVDPDLLVSGENVLAVEVHQRNDTSSDVSFDLSLTATISGQGRTLVSQSSDWRYLDDGSDQGTAWRAKSFNDVSWPTGTAQFGYGEDDQQTVLDVYTAGTPRVRTYYFRHEFNVDNPAAMSSIFLNLLRDDGAAVYLNGNEIRRDNLPDNALYDTFAESSVNGASEGRFLRSSVSASELMVGRNVLAVEVHQHSDTSSDVAFDLELLANIDGVRTDVVSRGSAWKYLDDGSDQGTAWRASNFNDTSWSEAIAQFGYGDVETGTSHVAIGREDWFEGGAGGVAFVNSFDLDGRNVSFVFTNGAGNSAKNIAEAATHEAGHTFGLGHQSTFDPVTEERLESYNPGSGDWAPHMGVGYSRPLTTWHDGPTGSIDNFQDDMARIARNSNGFGYRDDDHGGTVSTATTLLFPGFNDFSMAGIIERNSDVDAFSISVTNPQGGISVTLEGAEVGTNLDAVLELRNSNGTVVARSDPSNSYGAEITSALSAGDYTLFVRNNGEYGRVGQYTLTGAVDENDADFELNPLERIGPLGSLVARSHNNLGRVNFPNDVDSFSVPVGRDQQVAALITPTDPTATIQAGWSGDPLAVSGIGEPVVVPIQQFEADATIDLQVTSDTPTGYVVDFLYNATFESPRNSTDSPTTISATGLGQINNRLAVVGNAGDGSDATFTLVPTTATWSYLDDGSNQGNNWRTTTFDDSSWPTGQGQFGYGDGDETTLVNELDDNGDRIRTFYFRHEFNVEDVNAIESLLLTLIRDDGAAVYVNGTQAFRNNLSASARFDEFADKVSNEALPVTATLPASLLVDGRNVLAVEVHQESDTSSDVSFEMSLQANVPAAQETRIQNTGAFWRYLDDGSNQGTAWRGPEFDDSAWPQARAEFGYGDNDERTELNQNQNGERIRTFYFRKDLNLSNAQQYESIFLDVRYDDGVAIYVNGVEYGRDRLSANAEFDDWATTSTSSEDDFETFAVPAEAFVNGSNTIAVEVHQASATSSDVSFDMSIRGLQKMVEVDSYEFLIGAADVGKPYGVFLSGVNADMQSESLQVIGPNGTVVATASGTDGDNVNLSAEFVPSTAGEYRIELRSFLRDDYVVIVTPNMTLDTEPPTATTLDLGDLALGHVGGIDNGDTYTIPLDAGQTVAILTQTPYGDADTGFANTLNPQIQVFASDGTLIASDADSGFDDNALLTWTPTTTDVYTVDILPESGAGEYTLRIAIPGDANLDGQVDTGDWNLWSQFKFQSGTAWSHADFNGDWRTDGSDFNIWNDNRFAVVLQSHLGNQLEINLDKDRKDKEPRVPRAAAQDDST